MTNSIKISEMIRASNNTVNHGTSGIFAEESIMRTVKHKPVCSVPSVFD